MGCVKSRIDSDEVQRCKDREQLINEAVAKRHTLAAVHNSYVSSLKNVGAAIKQFEIISSESIIPVFSSEAVASAAASVSASPIHALMNSSSILAPPQPPGFSPRPLHRAHSLPPIPIEIVTSRDYQHQPVAQESENDALESDDTDNEHLSKPAASEFASQSRRQTPLPTPRMTSRTGRTLSDILTDIDNLFLNSFTVGRSVNHGYLHAQKTLTHGFSPNGGNLQHHQEVSRMLSWSKSPEGRGDRNGVDNLASILDKLHAWEKKLCDETKSLDVTESMLQKKQRHLERKAQRGARTGVEEAKISVHSLKMKYHVEQESIDQIRLEIRKLRDEHLFPLLMKFLHALKDMWKGMYECHEKQAGLIKDLMKLKPDRNLNTKGECGKITNDLENAVKPWRDHLVKMVESERDWMEFMAKWSRNMAISERGWAEDLAKRLKGQNGNDVLGSSKVITFLERLCNEWRDMLKNVPYEKVRDALDKFIDRLHNMAMKQNDESESLKKSDYLEKDLEKKKQAIDNLTNKLRQQGVISGEALEFFSRDPLHEKKELVELLERQLQAEKEMHEKLQTENRAMMLVCLQQDLPNVLTFIRDFSQKCMTEYEGLYERMKERI